MVSLNRNTPQNIYVELYCHFKQYSHSTGQSIAKVWDKWNKHFGLARVCPASVLWLSFYVTFETLASDQLRLLFSFFSENATPKYLAGGVWNCSVEHYPSFQHHLLCNLQTECEDGRDESGDCSFSGAECQGLIASCDRCYKIIHTHPEVDVNTDTNSSYGWANDYCRSLGGVLSLPKCVHNWYESLQADIKRHQNLFHNVWVGLYTSDISLPNMYRSGVTAEDKTVIYHTAKCFTTSTFGERKACLHTTEFDSLLYVGKCDPQSAFGMVCEFRKNVTTLKFNSPEEVSLVETNISVFSVDHSLATCHEGQLMYTVVLCASHQFSVCGLQKSPCVFPRHLSHWNQSDRSGGHDIAVPTFTCKDQVTTVSYSLLCDFIVDCRGGSDESFCTHPECTSLFTCDNSQCISFDKVCDKTKHCRDDSDETKCQHIKPFMFERPFFPSPALINFDGVMYFASVPMKSNESCPASHYRCPGDFNDCLPVYTRCNGMYDCIDQQDEEQCGDLACPGFFQCRMSTTCLHTDHLCDGWPHCPHYDDELFCHLACPLTCVCQGHSFLCPRPFPARLFPQLRSLDATGSEMTLTDVSTNHYLGQLVLALCSVTFMPDTPLANLRFLDLSGNKIHHVDMTTLLGFPVLQAVSFANNPLHSLHSGPSSVDPQNALTAVDLSLTSLTEFDSEMLSLFPRVEKLNLSFSSVHTISSDGFRSLPQLSELYLEGSPVKTFTADLFKELSKLKTVTSDNYKLCCDVVLPDTLTDISCSAPTDEVSSCKDLMQSWVYRGVLWLMTCLSMLGNVFCLCARFLVKSMKSSSGFGVFVTNLNLADFLMGVYVAFIAIADEVFRGRYFHHDDAWKSSIACQLAGFLALLSSEASALIIWLITLDRFIVIRFPFSTVRFNKLSAAVACLVIWCLAGVLASVPLLPSTVHWQFYGQTGICIPLPVTRRDFQGRLYSFSIMIVLNFLLLLFISAGQGFIYSSIQSNALKSTMNKMSRDLIIARRLISVALSDFLCWFPIGFCCILAMVEFPVPGEVNIALAVLVLPVNSAINPFLYTLNTMMEKRRKASEEKLFHWMQNNMHSI